MARAPIQKLEDLGSNFRELVSVLNEGPDISAVLIGAAYVDQALRTLIASKLLADPITEELLYCALSDFAVRIDAAFALGLLHRKIRADLVLISKMRNRFAHGHLAITFDDLEIKNWCGNLDYARSAAPPLFKLALTPRGKYCLTIALITNAILLDITSTKHCDEDQDLLKPYDSSGYPTPPPGG